MHVITRRFGSLGVATFLTARPHAERLRLCKEVELLTTASLRYAEALNQFRNLALHDIRQIPGFSLSAFANEQLVPDDRVRRILGPIASCFSETSSLSGIRDTFENAARVCVIYGLVRLLVEAYVQSLGADLDTRPLDREAVLAALDSEPSTSIELETPQG